LTKLTALIMKFLFLALLLVVVVASDVEAKKKDRRENFLKFARKHGRNISDPREHDRRLALYARRKEVIDQHNEEAAQGLHTFTLDENQFSDRSEAEIQLLTGAIVPEEVRWLETAEEEIDVRAIPASVDLRNASCMPAVKNQGRCGSCWAFAAITPLEYKNCKKTGKMTLLSEQQLTSCSKQACEGGFYTTAWDYIKSAGGIMSSASFPYTATKTTCQFSASKVVTKVSSNSWVGSESGIAAAIAAHGPVPVAIFANSKFVSYKSGVFNDPTCPTDKVNHAVVAVGYGTDKTAGDFWIIRNSWGPSWGDKGYIRMKRGVKMCAIGWAAYVTIA